MRRAVRVWIYLSIAAVLILLCGAAWLWKVQHPNLPYHDNFTANGAGEWRAYGGTWRLKDGTVLSRSDERGAKIITGNEAWGDYKMTADMMMLGHGGDIGTLVRVQSAETGINSYRGYYIGIRTADNALIMGAADHDWIEARPIPIRGGVHFLVWYRLEVIAVGCSIATRLENLKTGELTRGAMEAAPCFATGKIGFRTLNTGAAWRQLHVELAGPPDLAAMLKETGAPSAPMFPTREDEYSRSRMEYHHAPEQLLQALLGPAGHARSDSAKPQLQITSIRSLEMTRSGETTRLHGVVTQTDPLYIQDSSGGIRVELESSGSLNVGDEVEVVGKVSASHDLKFEAGESKLLWDRTLVTPTSMSSTQAASGAFEGSLVELSGVLSSSRKANDGTLTLEVEDMEQHFTVRVPQGITGNSGPGKLWAGSTLRIQGVCTAASLDQKESSFLLLPRSMNDITVIASPPWNRGLRLMILIMVGILLVATVIFTYLHAEQWKMRAVIHERERLAMDIHDTLAQSFAGVGYHLQSMRRGLQLHGGVPTSLMQKLDLVCSMTAFTNREASERITALYESGEMKYDILDQLRQSALSMLSGSHLEVELKRDGRPGRFSVAVHEALLAIGREAIANVLRHSKATEVRLTISYGSRTARLTIEDNGEGFDPAQKPAGLGRQSMMARAQNVGASLEFESAAGQGTGVVIQAPYGKKLSIVDWLRAQLLNT